MPSKERHVGNNKQTGRLQNMTKRSQRMGSGGGLQDRLADRGRGQADIMGRSSIALVGSAKCNLWRGDVPLWMCFGPCGSSIF